MPKKKHKSKNRSYFDYEKVSGCTQMNKRASSLKVDITISGNSTVSFDNVLCNVSIIFIFDFCLGKCV